MNTQTQQLTRASVWIPSHYICFDNFLTVEDNRQFLDYAIEDQASYLPAPTSTDDPSKRKALSMQPSPTFSQFSNLVLNRIETVWTETLTALKVQPFSASKITVQLIAQNDGDYVKRHCDRNTVAPDRKITFVYYLHQQPKLFSGGEFVLYDSHLEAGTLIPSDSRRIIQPINNRLLLFVSRNFHEVLPVQCASGMFAHSRFAFSGWFHQAELLNHLGA